MVRDKVGTCGDVKLTNQQRQPALTVAGRRHQWQASRQAGSLHERQARGSRTPVFCLLSEFPFHPLNERRKKRTHAFRLATMAFSAGISAADSAVYRAICNDTRGHPTLPTPTDLEEQGDGGRSVDYTNRWTFLQKLLAIETAHDRRRMNREKVGKSQPAPHLHTYHRWSRTDETTEPQLLSRWLCDQVLEDRQDVPSGSDLCSNTHRRYLPTLDTTNKSSTQVSHSDTYIDAHTSGHVDHSSDNHIKTWTNALLDNDRQATPMTDSDRTTPVSLILGRQSDQENKVPEIKPTRKRQLRLPPILLPRVHTVTPRPLQYREFLTPTKLRGPITDEEWEDLRSCRYIRHVVPRLALQVAPSNLSSVD